MYRDHHYTTGNPIELSDDEATYWLGLTSEGRTAEIAARKYREYRAARHERIRKYFEEERARREREADPQAYYREQTRKLREQREAEWRAGLRSKPHHLRKRWRSKERIGTDTRRVNAAGKLIGGHHGKDWDDRMHDDDLRKLERRLGQYVRYCYMAGLEVEDFALRIDVRTDWDERKLRILY
jgi:hypothetical protein